jgi:hypothetical protein
MVGLLRLNQSDDLRLSVFHWGSCFHVRPPVFFRGIGASCGGEKAILRDERRRGVKALEMPKVPVGRPVQDPAVLLLPTGAARVKLPAGSGQPPTVASAR